MARTAATITMSMREVDRVKTVQTVVDRMLPVGLAAKRLGLSRRQLERLLLKYKAHGAAGLVSAKRGHPSNHQLAPGAAERALRTGQSIHVRRDGDRRSPSLQPIESTERLPPPCRSDDTEAHAASGYDISTWAVMRHLKVALTMHVEAKL